VIAAFDRHFERIYNTTRSILDAMAQHRSSVAISRPE
jgi:hypothetical protein